MRRLSLLPGLLAGWLLAVALPVATAPTLSFCVFAHVPPMYLHNATDGIEVAVARELAAALEREAVFVRVPAGAAELEHAFREGRCDIVLGALASTGTLAGPPLESALLTQPYYAAGYRLVRRPDTPPATALENAGDSRLAVEGESIVTFTLRQRGRRVQVMYDADSVIEAVAAGKASYGYLWGPVAAWKLKGREDVVLAPEFRPEDRWDFALALRPGEEALYREVDEELRRLLKNGGVREIFADLSIPYLAPSSHSLDQGPERRVNDWLNRGSSSPGTD